MGSLPDSPGITQQYETLGTETPTVEVMAHFHAEISFVFAHVVNVPAIRGVRSYRLLCPGETGDAHGSLREQDPLIISTGSFNPAVILHF